MARKKVPSEFSDYLRAIGRKGGKERAKNLSPERRTEIAKKAAKARWDKPKK